MSEDEQKALVERRAELERQLEGLKAKRKDESLYMPGITIISEEEMPNEQIELEIEELEASIAEIDEELKHSGAVAGR
jgi:hypothetical protein